MAKVRGLIETLSRKYDWDAEISIDGFKGDIEISETVEKGKRKVDIHPVRKDKTGWDDTIRSTVDKYGRKWELPSYQLCPECGQPDSCGDCNHGKLKNKEVLYLGGSL